MLPTRLRPGASSATSCSTAARRCARSVRFYDLAPPEHRGTLAQWIEVQLQRPPVVGDGLDWSGAHFSVRQMDGGRVLRVGLSLGALSS